MMQEYRVLRQTAKAFKKSLQVLVGLCLCATVIYMLQPIHVTFRQDPADVTAVSHGKDLLIIVERRITGWRGNRLENLYRQIMGFHKPQTLREDLLVWRLRDGNIRNYNYNGISLGPTFVEDGVLYYESWYEKDNQTYLQHLKWTEEGFTQLQGTEEERIR